MATKETDDKAIFTLRARRFAPSARSRGLRSGASAEAVLRLRRFAAATASAWQYPRIGRRGSAEWGCQRLADLRRPLSRCSFVYYPAQPPEAGVDQFGVGPHTDFGVLTVLAQDATGGLQVETADGAWVHAPPIPGTLVVNVGDLLARWTAGAYRSTPHRVVNRSGQERLSLVLAFDPDPETRIDPAEVFGTAPDGAEPAITCGDYLLWRFGRAFAYRQ
ncbi:MAG: 2OG-Fe(II) oxygenase family protein [Pseudomonadota bacterium]